MEVTENIAIDHGFKNEEYAPGGIIPYNPLENTTVGFLNIVFFKDNATVSILKFILL